MEWWKLGEIAIDFMEQHILMLKAQLDNRIINDGWMFDIHPFECYVNGVEPWLVE